MQKFINTLKTDLNHVFVKGDSDKAEQARVFVLLAVPALSALFSIGQYSIY